VEFKRQAVEVGMTIEMANTVTATVMANVTSVMAMGIAKNVTN
jgi:hypothetical protein